MNVAGSTLRWGTGDTGDQFLSDVPTAQARSTYCIHRRIGIVQKILLFNPPIVPNGVLYLCKSH